MEHDPKGVLQSGRLLLAKRPDDVGWKKRQRQRSEAGQAERSRQLREQAHARRRARRQLDAARRWPQHDAANRVHDRQRLLGDGHAKMGAHGKPVLFLHPKDFCGTLIELEQA